MSAERRVKRRGFCEGVRLCEMCEAYGTVTQEMGLFFIAS